VTELTIEPALSTVAVRTRAAGLLARFAHDLEIRAAEVRGRASVDGDTWTAELAIPVVGLRVAGVLRDDRVDSTVLSANDRLEIERKLREEVLPGTSVVRVRASGASRGLGEARIELTRGNAAVRAPLATREAPDASIEVSGNVRLSLRALGIQEIKAPLGAFKVRDDVEVRFALTLRSAG
jgi:hypothetical protein